MAALTKFDIAGKHAIVTGGAQGLSRGMAEGLLEAGCKVPRNLPGSSRKNKSTGCHNRNGQRFHSY